MDRERFARLSEAFAEALDRPAEAREAFLAGRFEGDAELLGEARRMLAAHAEEDTFLQPPTDETLGTGRHARVLALAAGVRIGGFELLEPLGAGGMGEVWRARQERPRREVALKALRVGLSTERERRRFEDEAETLARLAHPGIAQVLAAGVVEREGLSVPWFALELIEGARPLDACARELPLERRLELVREVCAAVHHGHLRGVVHRDLKPDNILVGADGRARVIDFGIARTRDAAAPEQSLTGDGALLGTLAYMAPEQVRGDVAAIDARTDVHALGVILHELCTGGSPWAARRERSSWTRLASEVRDGRPSKPSEAADVAQELDWIVGRALEKEPERRYESAGALAEDLRRFLDGEAVAAGPPSALYRGRKFAARHRSAVVGGLAALALLVLGTLGTTYGLLQSLERGRELEARGVELTAARDEAEAARDQAQERLDRALAINGFLDDMLRGSNPFSVVGVGITRESTVGEMLDRAADGVDRAFEGRPELEAQTRLLIGLSYHGQGQYAQAERHLSEALRLFDGLPDVTLADRTKAQRLLATTRARSGRDREQQLTALLDAREAAYAGLDDDYPELGALDAEIAWLLQEMGRLEESRPYAQSAYDRFETLGPEFIGGMATASGFLAAAERLSGDAARIEASYRRTLELMEQGFGPNSLHMATARSNYGKCLLELGRPQDARAELEGAIATARGVLSGPHPTIAVAQYNLAYALSLLGDREGALQTSLDCLRGNRALYGEQHLETADAIYGVALSHYDLAQFDAAAVRFGQAADVRAGLLGPDHKKSREARARTCDAILRHGDPEALEAAYGEL
ncbi:MAG: serine/threonine-protein kinase, partial [Planctomycetota bacterium]